MFFDTPIYAFFLALVVLIYWRIGWRSQNRMLLVASYIFYGWWDVRFLGLIAASTVVDYYCARTGYSVTPEQWRFYEVYGLFRLGVIAQQIYYRYFHRQTTNEAYARFLPMTIYLEERCNRLIDEAAS